jgi:hypothetical protein
LIWRNRPRAPWGIFQPRNQTGIRMTQISAERPSDEHLLRHLGAAVLLCWHDLPLSVQGKILSQSNDVIGVAPIPTVRDEIVRLVLRRAPRDRTSVSRGV